MKKFVVLLGFCILFIGFISFSSQAQEASSPQYMVVFEEFVIPSDLPAYAKVQEDVIQLWKEYQMDISLWSFRNDDNAYYWIFPMENFAGLDGLWKKMDVFTKKLIEEEEYDLAKESRDLFTGRQTVLLWSPDLSYHPQGNSAQYANQPFVEWSFCYLKAGHEKEAAAAIQKYIEFYEGINETYEWDVYIVMLGHDTPCWILMSRGESELAIRKLEKDLNDKYGQQFGELWAEFGKHVRKMENKKGWYLPKWSINLTQ